MKVKITAKTVNKKYNGMELEVANNHSNYTVTCKYFNKETNKFEYPRFTQRQYKVI